MANALKIRLQKQSWYDKDRNDNYSFVAWFRPGNFEIHQNTMNCRAHHIWPQVSFVKDNGDL